MKIALTHLLFALAAVTLTASTGNLFQQQPPEAYRAAGLHKLTEEELAALEAMFLRMKSGEIVAIKQEAEQKVAAAEAKAQEGGGGEKKSGPGWLRALVTLQSTTEKSGKADPLQTRIAGEFRGWRGKTQFRLDNGQIWLQDDDTAYVGVNFDSPAVKIYPGMLGSFWMEVENVRPRVRVKPLKLQ